MCIQIHMKKEIQITPYTSATMYSNASCNKILMQTLRQTEPCLNPCNRAEAGGYAGLHDTMASHLRLPWPWPKHKRRERGWVHGGGVGNKKHGYAMAMGAWRPSSSAASCR